MKDDPTMHGTSSEVQASVLPAHCSAWQLRTLWQSYQASGDGRYFEAQFKQMVRQAHIVPCVIFDERWTRAIFGLELMRDDDGPYTSFLFYEQIYGRLVPIARQVIDVCWRVAVAYHDADGGRPDPARLLLKGREGWQRLVPRLGVKIDGEGWISEDQERFGYGH